MYEAFLRYDFWCENESPECCLMTREMVSVTSAEDRSMEVMMRI